ncbi:MAG TPA: hypothetical protein VFE23_17630 [Usitatibacter sp.]|jgi:hypothetical protein|nr:hypothetical protein [Usitatibacter sp.]
MPATHRAPADEVARLQQMLDYVLQHVRAREHSLDDPRAQLLFDRARNAIHELQDQIAGYLPHASQRAQQARH